MSKAIATFSLAVAAVFCCAAGPASGGVQSSAPQVDYCDPVLQQVGDAICPADVMDITDGEFAPLNDKKSQRETVDQFKASFRARFAYPRVKNLTIVIYFHGGLVDRNDALKQARLVDPFLRASIPEDHPQTVIAPFYVVYNVGAVDSVEKGDRERGLFTEDLDVRSVGLISRSIISHRQTKRRYESGQDHGDLTRTEDGYRETGNPIASALGRYGLLAWSYMKQVVLDSLNISRTPKTADVSNGDSCDAAKSLAADPWPHILRGRYEASRAGGLQLICELGNLIQQRADERNMTRIVFVGHSTGSIFITQMVRKMKRLWTGPEFAAANSEPLDIVFLAPAVSYEDFAQVLDRSFPRVRNVRIFTMDDSHEMRDAMLAETLGPLKGLAGIYKSSLLYAVSGIFEPQVDEPLLGLDRFRQTRTLQRYDAYDKTHKPDLQTALNGVRIANIQQICLALESQGGSWNNAFVLSPTPTWESPPFASRAVDHGDFVSDPLTLESVSKLIRLTALGSPWPTSPAPPADVKDDRYSGALPAKCTF